MDGAQIVNHAAKGKKQVFLRDNAMYIKRAAVV